MLNGQTILMGNRFPQALDKDNLAPYDGLVLTGPTTQKGERQRH